MVAKLGTGMQAMFFETHREGVLPLHIIRGMDQKASVHCTEKTGRREETTARQTSKANAVWQLANRGEILLREQL
ncbi:MAG: hypothetical protein KBB32_01515 [Spirochaetia bacterium]|nr:hypothetical protein [Spirochaetia bacterium]